MRRTVICLLGLSFGLVLQGGEIEGIVVIKHKLTKRAVTAPVGSYDRGATVELQPDPPNRHPLVFERTHVVIYLEGEIPGRPSTAVLEQRNRRFFPDLIAIPAGSTVSFPNSDPIFHNVFSLSKPKNFDLGNYPQGQTRTVTFSKPGIVLVNCHLHSNMGAVIVVTPNHFAARAGEDGKFTMHGVPPGKYTIVAWHKAAGFVRRPITVSDQHTARVEFIIPLDEQGLIDPRASSLR